MGRRRSGATRSFQAFANYGERLIDRQAAGVERVVLERVQFAELRVKRRERARGAAAGAVASRRSADSKVREVP